EVRERYGGTGISDEELLLRFYAGPEQVETMKAAGPRKEYLNARHSLVRLVEEISRKRDLSRVYIRKGDYSLTMEQRS
ncbi:MAG: hypothetical protein QF619_10400, partial [Candidatus Binatia bacterium]|nr:hypothetical protein [Candidatus Binatia bacterium]